MSAVSTVSAANVRLLLPLPLSVLRCRQVLLSYVSGSAASSVPAAAPQLALDRHPMQRTGLQLFQSRLMGGGRGTC